MGFRTGSYCTVWSAEQGKGNFTKVRLTAGRKNRDTGEFEQDFSGFCTFIGVAHTKAASLKERDRIKLGDVDVTNTYDKESRREYVNYKVFSFEMADASGSGNASGGGAPAPATVESNDTEGDDGNMPF